MTTQQAPHTPLWRRVRSLPHTRLGRWAIGLSGGSGLLLLFGLFLDVFLGLVVSSWVWIFLIAGILAGAVVGLIALVRSPQLAPPIPLSRRVVYVWLAVVPVALLAALPIAFIAQFWRFDLRRETVVLLVLYPVGWAAGVVALHFAQRGSERYGLGGTIYSLASLIGVALYVAGSLIVYVSPDSLVGTNLIGVGLWAATIGLTALAIVTIYARVVPWWGGATLLVPTPFGGLIIFDGLFSFLPESWKVVGWGVVPWVVVGFAVLLAARRRRNERPARVR